MPQLLNVTNDFILLRGQFVKVFVLSYLSVSTNTNALIEMSLRVKRSNLTENEIATPFGLAMTM